MSMQQTEHVMESPVSDSSISGQVPVQGKTSYGEQLLKPMEMNSWISNIAQEFTVGIFNYSTTHQPGASLFADNVVASPTENSYTLPWFSWFISHYQSFECQFDLLFEVIQHSAHRGAFTVSFTIHPPSPNNLTSLYLPIATFDISGVQDQDFVYSLPAIYGFPQKTQYDKERVISPNKNGLGALLNPRMAWRLGYLQVNALLPLASSSMLPLVVDILIKLRPRVETLKVSHAVLPNRAKLVTSNQVGLWDNE